jgi:hypothetical protein
MRHHSRSVFVRRALALVFAASLVGTAFAAPQAQEEERPAMDNGLRRRIEETWRVIPLQRGLVLVPRRASVRVKGIELGDGVISLDGRIVTGTELSERLGADAEPVLQLSYLPLEARAALLAPPDLDIERARPTRPLAAARQPRPPLPVEASPVEAPRFRHGRSGARVRVFGPVTVREGEQVGDVVAVFGSIDMRGAAHGNVVSIWGDVDMGPKASASGDVVAIGGRLRTAPGALASGKFTEVRVGWPDIQITVPGDDQFSLQVTPDWRRIARAQWFIAGAGSLVMLAVCVFTVLVAPRAVSAAARPGRSLFLGGLVGLAVQILLLPAILLIASALTLSVVGIPLLAGIPVLLFGVALAAIVGFTGVAARFGSVWRPRGDVSASATAVVIGLSLIWVTGLTGRYLFLESGGESGWGVALAFGGAAIEYVCWTVGLGSAVMAWTGRRNRGAATARLAAPPPVPPESPIAATF